MPTIEKPPCLCGCVRSDEAVRLRKEREAKAAAEKATNDEAFDRYYADLKAGRPVRTPAEYLAEVRKEKEDEPDVRAPAAGARRGSAAGRVRAGR